MTTPVDSSPSIALDLPAVSKSHWQTVLHAKNAEPLAFEVTQNAATEPAYTGRLTHLTDLGMYQCICCNQPLFASHHKFDSGTGWPSYDQPLKEKAILIKEDNSYGIVHQEVLCSACGAHMGHVFQDGPTTTGLRYCINSAALQFEASPTQFTGP